MPKPLGNTVLSSLSEWDAPRPRSLGAPKEGTLMLPTSLSSAPSSVCPHSCPPMQQTLIEPLVGEALLGNQGQDPDRKKRGLSPRAWGEVSGWGARGEAGDWLSSGSKGPKVHTDFSLRPGRWYTPQSPRELGQVGEKMVSQVWETPQCWGPSPSPPLCPDSIPPLLTSSHHQSV